MFYHNLNLFNFCIGLKSFGFFSSKNNKSCSAINCLTSRTGSGNGTKPPVTSLDTSGVILMCGMTSFS